MIRIYTVPSYFQGPRISRILYIYNVISQLYVTRIDVAREQNRFTVVVSLGIHTRVAILFSHRPANAKKANASSENENLCSSAAPIFPLPSSPFPSQPIVSRLDLDAKYSSTFRSGEWKKKFKNAIRYFLLYIYIYFSCIFEKLFTWNIMIW